PEEVISLTLEAPRLSAWSTANRSLFGNLPGLQPAGETHELGELVDQLRARLGRDACYTLEAQDQHTPERAWNRAPPLRRPWHPERGHQVSRPRKRPLWLFDPPRQVDPRQLVLLEGPERIHTPWWFG